LAADLEELAGLVGSGLLRVVVDQVFPSKHAAKAHEPSETGRVTGKIVLTR
jgi:NADPH:quinone reductase-like Zn-dependent oxidoreductase